MKRLNQYALPSKLRNTRRGAAPMALIALCICFGSLVCVGLLPPLAHAQSGFPLISSGVVDYGLNTLTINGTNLGLSPKVTLGTATLTIRSATSTKIVANFPSAAL